MALIKAYPETIVTYSAAVKETFLNLQDNQPEHMKVRE
jgi:hypothetical protein